MKNVALFNGCLIQPPSDPSFSNITMLGEYGAGRVHDGLLHSLDLILASDG